MSHKIETHGRQAAAIFARKDAWHQRVLLGAGRDLKTRAFDLLSV